MCWRYGYGASSANGAMVGANLCVYRIPLGAPGKR